MPIYAYRCTNCGHAQDVLQKLSDPVLAVCPACAQATYAKQVTAAGFQLKGSGWYATDFRGDGKGGKKAEADGATPDAAKGDAPAPAGAGPAAAASGDAAAATSAAPTPGAAPVPAPSSAPAAAPSPAPTPTPTKPVR